MHARTGVVCMQGARVQAVLVGGDAPVGLLCAVLIYSCLLLLCSGHQVLPVYRAGLGGGRPAGV
jgi:hypothetical protein